jgi:hypothetical protein
MISLPNPTNKMNTINPMFELLYEKCRQDPDLLATIIDEYLTSLNDTQLNELEDFMVNNFGDE